MSYDGRESSTYLGNPVEFYRIQIGATIYRYTSSDQRVTVNVGGEGPQDYMPRAIERSEPEYSQEESGGGVNFTLPISDPATLLFRLSIPPDPVQISIYRKHSDDTDVVTLFTGEVTSVKFQGGKVEFECLPPSTGLRRKIPWMYFHDRCNWPLYSTGCGVARASYATSATLTSVSGTTLQAAAFAAQPDGWFNEGYIEISSGDRRYILTHVGNTITLQSPFPGLGAGAIVTAFAGCDKFQGTCQTKFSNLQKFNGWPTIPLRNPFETGFY